MIFSRFVIWLDRLSEKKRQKEKLAMLQKELRRTRGMICYQKLMERISDTTAGPRNRAKRERRKIAYLKSKKLPLHTHVGAVEDEACRHGDYAREYLRGDKNGKGGRLYRVYDDSKPKNIRYAFDEAAGIDETVYLNIKPKENA